MESPTSDVAGLTRPTHAWFRPLHVLLAVSAAAALLHMLPTQTRVAEAGVRVTCWLAAVVAHDWHAVALGVALAFSVLDACDLLAAPRVSATSSLCCGCRCRCLSRLCSRWRLLSQYLFPLFVFVGDPETRVRLLGCGPELCDCDGTPDCSSSPLVWLFAAMGYAIGAERICFACSVVLRRCSPEIQGLRSKQA